MDLLCSSRKYPYSPRVAHSFKGLEIPGGWGFPKTKTFKEMYEFELEFPDGWPGALIKNPFHGGGMDILWNYTS